MPNHLVKTASLTTKQPHKNGFTSPNCSSSFFSLESRDSGNDFYMTHKTLSSFRLKNVSASLNRIFLRSCKNHERCNPKRYGVLIESNKITVFADTGKLNLFSTLKMGSDENKDTVIKEYDFSSTAYTMSVFGSRKTRCCTHTTNALTKQAVNLTVKKIPAQTNNASSQKDYKFIVIKFADNVSLKVCLYYSSLGIPGRI